MKKLFLFLVCLTAVSLVHAQKKLTDENTLVVNDSITLKVGDEFIVNLPYAYEFVSIEEHKKRFNLKNLKKIGHVGSAVGGSLGFIGVATENIGVLSTGVDIITKAGAVTSVGMTAEAIDELTVSDRSKKIIAKKMRISAFQEMGSAENGYTYFAIPNIIGDKKKFKVEIEPALRTNEIILVQE
ncbi:hypothetical protein [Sphingobacterium lactis]|uniref:hypothetical protein n=1 Tax=Sphingobacterium lactis TaxID=797291 RepID=UPI003DA25A48